MDNTKMKDWIPGQPLPDMTERMIGWINSCLNESEGDESLMIDVAALTEIRDILKATAADREASERLLALAMSDNFAELRTQSEKYHRVMGLLADMQMKHGKCNPREDRACTNCNATDDLAKLMAGYGGPPVIAA